MSSTDGGDATSESAPDSAVMADRNHEREDLLEEQGGQQEEQQQHAGEERLQWSDGESVVVVKSDEEKEEDAANEEQEEDDDEVEEVSHQRRRQRRRRHPQLDDDEEEEEDEDSPPLQVSLNDIKRQLTARRSSDRGTMTSTLLLRQECTCLICRDLLYDPVTLGCGHSFCHTCLHWWCSPDRRRRRREDEQRGGAPEPPLPTCPTCRSRVAGPDLPSISTALRACVAGIFGDTDEWRERVRRATAGEDGGAHERGYERLAKLEEEDWREVAAGEQGKSDEEEEGQQRRPQPCCRLRRSLVLDAQDERMQLTLALDGKPQINEEDATVSLRICLLTLEEDEVAVDGGFPCTIQTGEDEHLICSKEDRFRLSTQLEIKEKPSERGGDVPVAAKLEFGQDGTAEYTVSRKFEGILCIRHDETGAEMEIALGGSSQSQGRRRVHNSRELIGGREMMGRYGEEFDEEEQEEEDDEANETEEDGGFVVDDADDDDVCYICKDVGDMIVCDGGDHEPSGCGRNFHVGCIGRTEVPDGDWICSDCARANDLEDDDGKDGGTRGHEFPVTASYDEEGGGGSDDSDDDMVFVQSKKSSETGRKRKAIEESDDDDDEAVHNTATRQREKTKPQPEKKRKAIIDSDSDDD